MENENRLECDKNQLNDLSAQKGIRSALASFQSDQSLRCALYGHM